jgi:protein-L-isoaspartate O-methyltransferase
MTTSTTSQSFFERMYSQDADPWAFNSSPYEQGRYGSILNALEHRRYQRALEPGCSVGVLTALLATICDQVVGMEISPTAAEYARVRCGRLANVRITCGALPEQIPGGEFDLIVLSEIGYYFGEEQFAMLAEHLIQRLADPGVLLAAHWLGRSKDHILSGNRVHKILRTLPGLKLEYSERHSKFRLDRWVKA